MKIIELLPEKLRDSRDFPLFTEVATMLEVTKDNYHTKILKTVSDLYDFNSDIYRDEVLNKKESLAVLEKRAQENIKYLFSTYLGELGDLFDYSLTHKRDLLRLHSGFYATKGTETSLRMVTAISGFDVEIYDYDRYNGLSESEKKILDGKLGLSGVGLNRCDVFGLIEVSDMVSKKDEENYKTHGSFLDTQLMEFIKKFLWVCVRFHVVYSLFLKEEEYKNLIGSEVGSGQYYGVPYSDNFINVSPSDYNHTEQIGLHDYFPKYQPLIFRERKDSEVQLYQERIKTFQYKRLSKDYVRSSIVEIGDTAYRSGAYYGGIEDEKVGGTIYQESEYVPYGGKRVYSRVIVFKNIDISEPILSKLEIHSMHRSFVVIHMDNSPKALLGKNTLEEPTVESYSREVEIKSSLNIRTY